MWTVWLSSVITGCLFVVAQDYQSLKDVYGGLEEVLHMEPIGGGHSGFSHSGQVNSGASVISRVGSAREDTSLNCTFPMEIVIIQDLTSSFYDDIPNMIAGLDSMYNSVRETHPDTRVSLVSVKDKPIWPLGGDGLYCAKVEAPFVRDIDQLKVVYQSLVSKVYGGGDPPEAQFHAIVGAATSKFIDWQTPLAVKLILIITDAEPHFSDDGFNTEDLPDFVIPSASKDLNEACETTYYPSPDQVAEALKARGAYFGMLISGGDGDSGRVGESWKWFNSKLGQIAGFYRDILDDSSNFWEQTEAIIGLVEGLECGVFPSTSTMDPSASSQTTPAPAATDPVSVDASTGGARKCGSCNGCLAYGCTCCCGNTVNCPYKDAKVPRRMFITLGN